MAKHPWLRQRSVDDRLTSVCVRLRGGYRIKLHAAALVRDGTPQLMHDVVLVRLTVRTSLRIYIYGGDQVDLYPS